MLAHVPFLILQQWCLHEKEREVQHVGATGTVFAHQYTLALENTSAEQISYLSQMN